MPNYNDPPTAAEQADWVDDDPSPAEIAASQLRECLHVGYAWGEPESSIRHLVNYSPSMGKAGPSFTLNADGRAVAKELENK